MPFPPHFAEKKDAFRRPFEILLFSGQPKKSMLFPLYFFSHPDCLSAS